MSILVPESAPIANGAAGRTLYSSGSMAGGDVGQSQMHKYSLSSAQISPPLQGPVRYKWNEMDSYYSAISELVS